MPLVRRGDLELVNPQQVLRIFPLESRTAPIAGNGGGRFEMAGSGQADPPTRRRSAVPRGFRRVLLAGLSTGAPDGPCVGKAQVSVDLEQPIANR